VPVPASALIAWLSSLGNWDTSQETGVPFYTGPYIPDSPDRLVVVTPTPGGGYRLEGATDVCGFQARVRGPQGGDGSPGAQAAAEAIAYRLDALIFTAAYPVRLPSGQVIVTAHRLSGAPAPLSGEPDDADRVSYVANYLIEVSN
jgi:hypothetical protein